MDSTINRILDDIRQLQQHPLDEIVLIGSSIHCHFETILNIYNEKIKLPYPYKGDGTLLTRKAEHNIGRRIMEFEKEVRQILEYLIPNQQEEK